MISPLGPSEVREFRTEMVISVAGTVGAGIPPAGVVGEGVGEGAGVGEGVGAGVLC